jgi:DNA-binding MarR family transcriptional regulator
MIELDERTDHDADELDFVLVDDIRPPSRITQARERYGAAFAASSDSCTLRTIGIYVFLRTLMCSPVRAGTIAQTLKLPKAVVNRRLQDMMKQGYVERVGNAYRMTDKVNIPDLQDRLQRRIDMIMETARELSKLHPQEM